ncbi:hypothetical protein [Leptolyngbya sp. FACHB-17]|uniref:hypothetical protein n=1 Tax=unclassified Leptolyngbya TaxID=2650499 RepID=UPI001680BEF0|nr:hypothetical protein [Leptolyngbya sp. FACHB-17]MBD2078801.1 hypothetical protein [Leptolyngbya sp. FACHB-17]
MITGTLDYAKMHDFDEFYPKAVKSYARYCDRKGYLFTQPSEISSDWDIETQQMTLRNGLGDIATLTLKGNRFTIAEVIA